MLRAGAARPHAGRAVASRASRAWTGRPAGAGVLQGRRRVVTPVAMQAWPAATGQRRRATVPPQRVSADRTCAGRDAVPPDCAVSAAPARAVRAELPAAVAT